MEQAGPLNQADAAPAAEVQPDAEWNFFQVARREGDYRPRSNAIDFDHLAQGEGNNSLLGGSVPGASPGN